MYSFFKALRNNFATKVIYCPSCDRDLTVDESRGVNVVGSTYYQLNCPKCGEKLCCQLMVSDVRIIKKADELVPISNLVFAKILVDFLQYRGKIYENEWNYFVGKLVNQDDINIKQIDDLKEKYNLLSIPITSIDEMMISAKRNLNYSENYWRDKIKLIEEVGLLNGSLNSKQKTLLSKLYEIFGVKEQIEVNKTTSIKSNFKVSSGNKEENEYIVKLASDTNCEAVVNLISEAADFATRPLNANIAKYRAGIRNILNKKLERVDYDQDKYIESLITNVIYYTNILPNIKYSFQNFLEENKILTEIELNQLIYNVQEAFKQPKYSYNSEDIKNKEKYLNMFPISKRVDALEYDYSYFYTYAEVLFELLAFLTNQSNNKVLLEANPKDIIRNIDNTTKVNVCNILGTLEMKL